MQKPNMFSFTAHWVDGKYSDILCETSNREFAWTRAIIVALEIAKEEKRELAQLVLVETLH